MEKVAVIGFGNIAGRHRHNLKLLFPSVYLYSMSASGRVPDDSVVNCDQFVSNLEDLITSKVELVIIASPAPYHAQHALPLIESGIPVLIEKPVATTLNDVERIQRAINEYNTPVSVGYCVRYMPSALKLKDFLKEGRIGALYNANIEVGQYLPDWRPNKDYRDCVSAKESLGGGVLFELSHELDYAQWLLGPLDFQYAMLRSSQQLDIDVEDLADILTVTQTNAVTAIHLDFLQRKAHRCSSFIGSEGRIDWDLIDNKLTLTTKDESVILYHERDWDKNKMYLSMIEDFVRMIRGESHTCATVREAEVTVSLVNVIKKNASYL